MDTAMSASIAPVKVRKKLILLAIFTLFLRYLRNLNHSLGFASHLGKVRREPVLIEQIACQLCQFSLNFKLQ
jgi:hypothetical protein